MSTDKLKVAVVSHDIAWGDKEENIISVAELLNRVDKDTDIVVLPELFSTGFMPSLEQLHEMAEDMNGITIVNLVRWAQFFKFAICGSYIAKQDGRYFNRAFFVEPLGDMTFYDKRQICYDVRFPIWCRNRDNKVDLMLVPANWQQKRSSQWKHLLIARAIENQIYVVGANRSGKDDEGAYDDMSYIFDYNGESIDIKSAKSSKIIYANLDKSLLRKNRIELPANKDADSFELL